MPVTLTLSRKLKDNSTHSGIRAVGVGAYNSTTRLVTTATGVIDVTSAFASASIARLEVKNTTTKYVETGVSGGDNRSTGYNGAITCMFNVPKGAEIETAKLITELTKGEFVFFLEYYDGTIKACGSQNGALATAPIADTGGTVGDMKGYTITFNTQEAELSDLYILSGAGITGYASALKAYV
jgi:hypothetical protein